MMNKSKSIKEIYNEVKDFDLVITNDAPLATALNKSVEIPRLGLLAMTPRQLAVKFGVLNYDRMYSKSELILEVTRQTGKSLKLVHQSIEKIIEIWNHTGLLESCELFLGSEKQFLKYLIEMKTVEYAMENFDFTFYESANIAVAGLELFNELDKMVIPKNNIFPIYIDLMSEKELNIDKTFLFNSSSDLINSVASIIDNKNQNDTAIIFNTDSELKNIFIAAFNQKGIDLEMKSLLRDDISTGIFLSIIESSFNLYDQTLKDMFFLEPLFGINIDRKFSNFNFSGYINSNKIINEKKDKGIKTLKNVYDILSGIEEVTFTQLYDKIELHSDKKFNPLLRKVIDLAGLGSVKVSPEGFNILKYFILNIDVETGRNKEGVLFVNAGNSAFVDRRITIFIGMDDSWTKLNADKSYVDKTEEEKKNLEKFQILLSQGEEKMYIALNVKKNQSVIPCYYFNMLSDNEIKKFEDKYFNPVFAEKVTLGKRKFEKVNHDLKTKEIKLLSDISQSALNSFSLCPKNYSYGKLIKEKEEKSYFLKGTLLHCYAEFYFNHSEYCREKFESILELLLKEYSGFINEINADSEKTSFRIGMKAIMDFLDSGVFEYEIDTHSKAVKKESNFLFNVTGLQKKYLNTEQWLKKILSCINGKIDLTSGQNIIDYKSGKTAKTVKNLINEFKKELLSKENAADVNYQTIAYLSGKREDNPDEKIYFTYLYILANYSDYIKGSIDQSKSVVTVTYIPETFKRYIISKEFYNGFDPVLTSKFLYEEYKKLLLEKFDDINFYNKDSISEKLEDCIRDLLLEEKGYVYKDFKKQKENTFREKIIQPVIKCLFEARTGSVNYPNIYKDDADEFIEFAKATISEINEYLQSDFPNKPVNDLRKVCSKCDYLNICIGNKLLTSDES